MSIVGDKPRALLLGLGGYVGERTLTQYPPPLQLLVPKRVPMTVSLDDKPKMHIPDHRIFKLDLSIRDGSRRWWRVYNEGRSQTPEDGFVYKEESPPPRPEKG